jgi:restriction system protein
MAIPDYESLMLPLLQFASDGKEHQAREATEFLSNKFRLTEQERKELLPSRTGRVIVNREGWAATHLKACLLIESTKRGYFKITQRGIDVLSRNLTEINIKFLEQFPEYAEFKKVKKELPGKELDRNKYEISPQTPEEILGDAYEELNRNLKQELLENIKSASPDFFEYLVVDLLVKMGYGGSRSDAGQLVGGSGDEGIDGIIKEDKLGLDAIYIQAKRWKNTIERDVVQKFAGALQGKRAKKGVLITTSTFTKGAVQYASNIESKIVLIDGEKLVQLMIEHNVGVSTTASYEVKQIDTDYFEK